MRGDLEAIAWRRYRDLHSRVRAIEDWISSFGTSSSKASDASIVDRISKAGKALSALVTVVRFIALALPFMVAGAALVWGWVKAWWLALLH